MFNMDNLPYIVAFCAAYFVIGVFVFGYYTGKYGSDGPDGLIPIFAGLFWWLIIPLKLIALVVSIPYTLGKQARGK